MNVNDPLFAVGMDEAGRRFDELITHRIEQRKSVRVELIAQEFNDHLVAVRNSLQTDITIAAAKAQQIVFRIEQAYRYTVVSRGPSSAYVRPLLS